MNGEGPPRPGTRRPAASPPPPAVSGPERPRGDWGEHPVRRVPVAVLTGLLRGFDTGGVECAPVGTMEQVEAAARTG